MNRSSHRGLETKPVLLFICTCFIASTVDAQIVVDPMFSDHMVLQRDLAVPISNTSNYNYQRITP